MPICYRLSVWLSCKNRLPTYCVYCVGADVKHYTIQSNPPVCKICLNSRVRTVSRWLVVSVAEFHAHVTAKRWYEVLAGMNSPWYERYKNPRMVRKIHGTKRPRYEKSTYGTKRLWYEKCGSCPIPLVFPTASFIQKFLGSPERER